MSTKPDPDKKIKDGWSHVSKIGALEFDHAVILREVEAEHEERIGSQGERAFEADMPLDDICHGNRIGSSVADMVFTEDVFGAWGSLTTDQRRSIGQGLHELMRDELGTGDFVRPGIRWYSSPDENDFGGYLPDEKYKREVPGFGVPYWRHSGSHPIELNDRAEYCEKHPLRHALGLVVTLAHEHMHGWQHMRLFELGLHNDAIDKVEAFVAKHEMSSDYMKKKLAQLANSFPAAKYASPDTASFEKYLSQACEIQAETFGQFVLKKSLYSLRCTERVARGDHGFHNDDPVWFVGPDDIW